MLELALLSVVISIDFIPPECLQRKHWNFVGIDSHSVECSLKFLSAQLVLGRRKNELPLENPLDIRRSGAPTRLGFCG